MVAEQLMHEDAFPAESKHQKFIHELLHTLAVERQCIHELGEKMFVVGALIGFALGMLTIGIWSFMRI